MKSLNLINELEKYPVFNLKIMKVNFNLELINKKLDLYLLKFDKNLFFERINNIEKFWSIDLKNLIFNELPDFKVVKKEIFEFL